VCIGRADKYKTSSGRDHRIDYDKTERKVKKTQERKKKKKCLKKYGQHYYYLEMADLDNM
jgi:hypothetical protein